MSWLSRFASVIRSGRLNRDLDHEMRFHLDARTEEYAAAGLPVEEARARGSPAIRQPGAGCATRAATSSCFRASNRSCATSRSRRGCGGGTRWCTAAALVSLSLAIGAWTPCCLLLIDALILRTLPADDPRSLVYLALRTPAEPRDGLSFNYPLFRELRAAGSRQVRLFAMSDQSRRDAAFDDSGQVEKVYGQWVSGDAFTILGVKPALGRVLASSDDVNPGRHPVAVLSYDFWTRRFG